VEQAAANSLEDQKWGGVRMARSFREMPVVDEA
jgi:hypothetical protein